MSKYKQASKYNTSSNQRLQDKLLALVVFLRDVGWLERMACGGAGPEPLFVRVHDAVEHCRLLLGEGAAHHPPPPMLP